MPSRPRSGSVAHGTVLCAGAAVVGLTSFFVGLEIDSAVLVLVGAIGIVFACNGPGSRSSSRPVTELGAASRRCRKTGEAAHPNPSTRRRIRNESTCRDCHAPPLVFVIAYGIVAVLGSAAVALYGGHYVVPWVPGRLAFVVIAIVTILGLVSVLLGVVMAIALSFRHVLAVRSVHLSGRSGDGIR